MRAGRGGHSPSQGNDLATTICTKAFITYVSVTVMTPNFLAADVFGSGILL